MTGMPCSVRARLRLLASRLAVLSTAVLALQGACAAAGKNPGQHQFGVIGHSFNNGGNEARLKQAIADTGEASLAFVVATGIKGDDEPCSDKLYSRRRALFDEARRPMIVAPAASDWSECKNSAGRSAAIERLNRLRDMLFPDAYSLGAQRLELTRLSSSAKFRSYSENAHWELGDVLYATVNLPANNNHYRAEAGRNSEYEDRLVANRVWLIRLFALAKRNKNDAVVLFSEGDVKALDQPTGLRALLGRASTTGRDGFAEPRRQIAALAQKFPGKVLLIDTAAPEGKAPAIAWRGNLGHLSLGSGAVEVRVTPGAGTLFTLREAHAKDTRAQR